VIMLGVDEFDGGEEVVDSQSLAALRGSDPF
jgi:hypothetical protein